MGAADPTHPRFLLVCTANICRSPMAEALLRNHLELVGVTAEVASSGHLAEGTLVSPNSVTAMADRSLDIAGRRSVLTSAGALRSSDLILTMGREHVRRVLDVEMSAWPRSFTLRAAVRRGLQVGPREQDESLNAWVGRLHDGRLARDMLSDDPADDIEDPYGAPLHAYRDTARLLDDLLGRLVMLAYPDLR